MHTLIEKIIRIEHIAPFSAVLWGCVIGLVAAIVAQRAGWRWSDVRARTLRRRAIPLAGSMIVLILLQSLPGVFSDRGTTPVILGRYTLRYFGFIVVWLAAIGGLACSVMWLWRHPDRIDGWLERSESLRHKPLWIRGGIGAIVAGWLVTTAVLSRFGPYSYISGQLSLSAIVLSLLLIGLSERTTLESVRGVIGWLGERAWLAIVLLALSAGLIVWVRSQRLGIGLTPDSTHYVEYARSLLHGRGYTNFNGRPVNLCPPGYSILLAGVSLSGLDPLDSARYLNIVLFPAIILLATHWWADSPHRLVYSLLTALLVAIGTPVLRVSALAWSEVPDALAILAFLLSLRRYVSSGRQRALILAAVWACLATYIRYTGGILVPVGVLVLLLYPRGRTLKNRIRDVLVLGLVSGIPVLALLVRNQIVSGSLVGTRPPPYMGITGTIQHTLQGMGGWYVAHNQNIVFLIILAIMLALFFFLLRHDSVCDDSKASLTMLLGWTAGYMFYVNIISTLVEVDPIGDRLLSQVYVAWCLLLLHILHSLQTEVAPDLPRAYGWVAVLLVCIWLVNYPLQAAVSMTRWMTRDGAGIFKHWKASETMQQLRETDLDGTVYTNRSFAVYVMADRLYKPLPDLGDSGSQAELHAFAEQIAGSPDAIHMVWFDWQKEDAAAFERLAGLIEIECRSLEDGRLCTYSAP